MIPWASKLKSLTEYVKICVAHNTTGEEVENIDQSCSACVMCLARELKSFEVAKFDGVR